MVLAAGRGERMRPLTNVTPKPLLPVGGKPLIAWHLERLAAAGFKEVVINHAHLGEQIENALGDGARFGLSITYSAEPAGALETAGGVANALPLLGPDPFLIISGDIYIECDYRSLLRPLAGNDTAFMWMVDNPDWHAQGDFSLVDGRLALEGGPRLTYANIGVFSPKFFSGIAQGERLPMSPLFKRGIAADTIAADRYTGLWDNLGNPSQLAQLDQLLRNRTLP